ncbi:hypothetical protein SELMODRAFT_123910 [Selaginella moellendorffii]|uniref:Pentacotripeptide-repeat region of PRORP domain-containing protein n=1 Tax=Selaginella moellendorffii TaxID=88036 RepID=D8SSG9_SELML|nr:hypothetical protein SELMODRAFT_123910 [Selaginella moellendorffii]
MALPPKSSRLVDVDLEVLEDNPGKATYASLLRQCGRSRALWAGKQVHSHMIARGLDRDKVLGDILVQMYGKCRSLGDARDAFERLAYRDIYSGMTPDVVVHNSLVNLYAKCGRIDDARSLFDGMQVRSLASWNAMIAGYAHLDLGDEAFDLFRCIDLEGLGPDMLTFINLLGACSTPEFVDAGRNIHARVAALGLDSNLVLATALLDMYAKCGSIEGARSVFASMADNKNQNSIINMYARCGSLDEARACFDSMPRRSVVSWNVLMSGYVEQQQGEESLKLVRCMDWQGIHPNAFTFSCVATACSLLKDLRAGRAAHSRIVASGFDTDRVVVTALMDMYGRCGSVEAARRTFDDMRRRCSTRVDVVSWNAMMGLYSHHGQPREALELFGEMGLAGEAGNEVSLTLVLHACTHAGLVADAVEALARGVEAGIVPSREHYACVVDVLARAGKLEVAEEVMNNMPVEPGIGAWKCLLGACAVHGDAGRGSSAAQHVVEMQPTNAAPYVLLSNIAKAPKP